MIILQIRLLALSQAQHTINIWWIFYRHFWSSTGNQIGFEIWLFLFRFLLLTGTLLTALKSDHAGPQEKCRFFVHKVKNRKHRNNGRNCCHMVRIKKFWLSFSTVCGKMKIYIVYKYSRFYHARSWMPSNSAAKWFSNTASCRRTNMRSRRSRHKEVTACQACWENL